MHADVENTHRKQATPSLLGEFSKYVTFVVEFALVDDQPVVIKERIKHKQIIFFIPIL